MDSAALIVADITGCTSDQGQAVIDALIEGGWSPPDTPSRADEPAAIPIAVASLDELPAGTVLTAHTDGACSGNPGPGGWAVIFSVEDAIVGEFSGGDPDTTSNRMELTAALEAIQRAPTSVTLEIVTDSQLVLGWLGKGWKRNNPGVVALCGKIDEVRDARAAANGGAVTFKHVRGHNGNPLNERADELATGAIRRV
jgi:ribonuclease HI